MECSPSTDSHQTLVSMFEEDYVLETAWKSWGKLYCHPHFSMGKLEHRDVK